MGPHTSAGRRDRGGGQVVCVRWTHGALAAKNGVGAAVWMMSRRQPGRGHVEVYRPLCSTTEQNSSLRAASLVEVFR